MTEQNPRWRYESGRPAVPQPPPQQQGWYPPPGDQQVPTHYPPQQWAQPPQAPNQYGYYPPQPIPASARPGAKAFIALLLSIANFYMMGSVSRVQLETPNIARSLGAHSVPLFLCLVIISLAIADLGKARTQRRVGGRGLAWAAIGIALAEALLTLMLIALLFTKNA